MRTAALIAASVAGVYSQSLLESSNFNITQQLLGHGVDLSILANVSNLMSFTRPSCCSSACTSLQWIFGHDQVESQSEPEYTSFINSYWSGQQRAMPPQCVFKPQQSSDVAVAVLLSRLWQCPFAVKSGGHSAVPGGSNIQGGITITFENMTSITLSPDQKIASVQPGNTWVQVYNALQPNNVTVLGGRAAPVGVGGLLLGGGFSYFSSMYGLACDNVVSYELVTAQGLIITVSPTSYSDLYWALRGGGPNFGIVTKFNLGTIPRLPNMWGGTRVYLESAFDTLLKAYYNLGLALAKDGKAHQILSFGYAQNMNLGLIELEYADPISNASELAEYNAIQGAIQDGTGIHTQAELSTLEIAGAIDGLRQEFWTFCTLLDEDLAVASKDIFFKLLPSVLDAANLVPALSLQVISQPMLDKMSKNGGNALGLNPKNGPLMLALVSLSWSNPADDQRLNEFAQNVKNQVTAMAAAKGKSTPYLYMNYASPWQDPLAGYGSENKARLQSISKKYDPAQVFQKLQPGYFKLTEGAPFGKLA